MRFTNFDTVLSNCHCVFMIINSLQFCDIVGWENLPASKNTICATRSSASIEIARVGGHYAFQGHSRSLSAYLSAVEKGLIYKCHINLSLYFTLLILIPIESPYAISY